MSAVLTLQSGTEWINLWTLLFLFSCDSVGSSCWSWDETRFSNVPRFSHLPGGSGIISTLLAFRPNLQGQGVVTGLQVSHTVPVFGRHSSTPRFCLSCQLFIFLLPLCLTFLPSSCDLDNEVSKSSWHFELVPLRSSSLHFWKKVYVYISWRQTSPTTQ